MHILLVYSPHSHPGHEDTEHETIGPFSAPIYGYFLRHKKLLKTETSYRYTVQVIMRENQTMR